MKASLTYKGGEIFGYAADDENGNKLATTLLCVMVKCFFTSETFLVKLLPCHALKADFLFNCLTDTTIHLTQCGAHVMGIIFDNNRVNQSCFKKFTPKDDNKPWIVESPANPDDFFFLMYDPVHLLKNIRNNWLSSHKSTLRYPISDTEFRHAVWKDLSEYFESETLTFTRRSKLSKSAINPSNLEKRKVPLALAVFSEETSAALKTSSSSTQSWVDTAGFIDKVVQLWKVWNCKSLYQSTRLNDPDRVVISNDSDRGIRILLDWIQLAEQMTPERAGARQHSFTCDTGKALQLTCQCLIDVSRYLLETQSTARHNYVPLGFFQQDDLEAHFGHFRMSAGCNFYISVQDVFATHNMDKAKLMLQHCQDIDTSPTSHRCTLCNVELSD